MLCAGGEDNRITCWNLETEQKIAELTGYCSHVLCAAIAFDGKRLVMAGSDNTLLVWTVPVIEQTVPARRRRMDRSVRWWEVCPMPDDYDTDDGYDSEDDLYADPLYEGDEYDSSPPEQTHEEDDESEFSPFPTAFYGFVAMIMGETWDE